MKLTLKGKVMQIEKALINDCLLINDLLAS